MFRVVWQGFGSRGLAALLLFPALASTADFPAQVVRIKDGDTIVV